MTAHNTIRRLGRGAAVTVALATVFAFAACDTARRVVDADDRERFIEATNTFTRASNQLQEDVEALEGRIEETPAFVEQAQDELATMKEQRDEVRSLAESVDGEARSIAEKAAQASTEVLRAGRNIVEALEAGDAAALEAALAKSADAIDAFNEQVRAWNDL